ncbi:FG-GAP repeat domain-containing protein [Actinacidiphila acidipaludis]|uniref:VCBS repeat-containing protein n=1 Tax=Actinacidiphila acidipaludis TaxID=2873382 RepID=A0ABS7QHX5_9ACTN|nr:VCBS repeat-containing protein [Streptomyces acidipaludis]MBY8882015.1 VCBS repeat-containing protein [Streptomyces acidipaludis]
MTARRPLRLLRTAVATALAAGTVLGSVAVAPMSSAAPATAATAAKAPNDFDGDGRSDLVGLDSFDRLAVLWRTGAETMIGGGDTQVRGFEVNYQKIATPGDLDGDGLPDVLAVRPSGQLRIFSSRLHETTDGGPGSTDPKSPTIIGGGWQAYSMLLTPGDLNADGRPDLLARGYDGSLWFYAGTGSATAPFKARVKVGTGWNMYDQTLGAGDFDGNGYGDVIARDIQGRLWLYPGVGGGKLGARHQIGTAWQSYNQLIGDVDWNGDGHLDLLARALDGTLYLYAGDGHGAYKARTTAGMRERTDAFADQGGIYSWGKNNLVGHLTNGHFAWYYANNDGTLTKYGADPWNYDTGMASAKRVTNPAALTDNGQLGYLYDDGYGNLILPHGSGIEGARSYSLFFAPGDLTGDGNTDLVVRTTSGGLYVLPGDGNEGFGTKRYVGAGWNIYNRIVGAGDFTGDGRTDIAATTPGGALYIYPGRGDGTFAARHYVCGGWQGYGKLAAPGDLTGDGKADLVGVDSTGRLWLYPGNGASAFGARREIGTAGWNGFSELS